MKNNFQHIRSITRILSEQHKSICAGVFGFIPTCPKGKVRYGENSNPQLKVTNITK